MKKVFKVALVAVCIMLAGNFAKAQTKIGYVAQDEVIGLLPELKTVQTQMQTYSKTWTDQLQSMQEMYQKSVEEYQKAEKTMTDAAKAAKVSEIQDMQKRMQETNDKARTEVDTKSNEYMAPLIKKVRDAVTAVAKEKGYTYVINTSVTDQLLLVAPDADNMLAAVKLKLGLK
ncbi:OmpH family outer membrane protein [Mucilaginibacter auburnensis]|uniref:Outer membrane protein n=1 Tax=Mucilaginibacter auburnensis TaxID=1457233 RepID=A0A2H9VUJ5_9SPHI|nr:OmpH family outer membrane protein [Mucilaginibacter auburnensis]PJJ84471.1 outer membrane protein [Mucilaginibacter auburnensis]